MSETFIKIDSLQHLEISQRRNRPRIRVVYNIHFFQIDTHHTYSRLPITRTFKGNWKKFELAGVRVSGSTKQITGTEEMGWGMNVSNMHTSKLNKYTVLDTVFKLDSQKSKDKEYVVVKIISMFRTVVHLVHFLHGA